MSSAVLKNATDGDGKETGVVLSYVSDKGYGFITPDKGGENIFFHRSKIKEIHGTPFKGQEVRFSLIQQKDSRFAARDVVFGELRTDKWCKGVVRKYDETRGFGFIVSEDTGEDVFLSGQVLKKALDQIGKPEAITVFVREKILVEFKAKKNVKLQLSHLCQRMTKTKAMVIKFV